MLQPQLGKSPGVHGNSPFPARLRQSLHSLAMFYLLQPTQYVLLPSKAPEIPPTHLTNPLDQTHHPSTTTITNELPMRSNPQPTSDQYPSDTLHILHTPPIQPHHHQNCEQQQQKQVYHHPPNYSYTTAYLQRAAARPGTVTFAEAFLDLGPAEAAAAAAAAVMTLEDLRLDYSAGGGGRGCGESGGITEKEDGEQEGGEWELLQEQQQYQRWDGAGGGGGWKKRKAEKERERVGVGKRRDKGKGRAVATAGCGRVPGHCPVGYQPASVEDGSDGDEARGCVHGFDKGKGVEKW